MVEGKVGESEMKIKGIDTDIIYRAPHIPGGGYAYVRGFRDDDTVGFSVLGKYSKTPDFSDCGVFWVKTEDFLKVFTPCRK